jgi:RHS repeat-associated protein
LHADLTYNSLMTTDYGLGAGWQVGPDIAFPAKLVNLEVTKGQDVVQRVSADGTTETYTHVPNSSVYLPPAGSDSQLTVNTDNGCSGGTSSWTLVDDDGSVYSFCPATGYNDLNSPNYGTLTLAHAQTLSSTTPNAPQLAYSYQLSSATDSPSYLTSITAMDSATAIPNATLHLYWNVLDPTDCASAILCVVGPDGVRWLYTGDASATSGNLQTVSDGTRSVFKVTYTGGLPHALYNADELAPGYSGSDSVTLCYGGTLLASCGAGSSPHQVSEISQGPISGQTPTVSSWTFQYHLGGMTHTPAWPAHQSANRTVAGYTVITPPCQQPTVSCPDVPNNGAATTVYYDGNDLTLEKDNPLGGYTETDYNANGQLLWSEDEQGNPTDYSYDAVDNTLTSVLGPPDPGNGGTRPLASYNYDENAMGTLSGGSYAPGPVLNGVQADYFSTPNLIPTAPGGRPDQSVTETFTTGSGACPAAILCMDWGTSGPSLLGQASGYSVRMQGDLNVPASDNYAFQLVADGCTQLIVDNELLIYNWTPPCSTTTSATPSTEISLTPGKHHLTLLYQEPVASTSNFALSWICADGASCGAGAPTSWTGVPASALTPAWDNQTSIVSPGGKVAYSHYNNPASGLAQYSEVIGSVNGGPSNSQLVTSFSYDGFGRVTGKVLPSGNPSPSFSSTNNGTYGLNSNDYGDLINAGNAASSNYGTTYAYYADSDQKTAPGLSGQTCASAGSNVYQLGLLETEQQHGLHAVSTIYDAAGQAVSVTKASGPIVSCYDGEGRLVARENTTTETNPTTYSYDANGNLLQESRSAGSGGSSSNLGYTSVGTAGTDWNASGVISVGGRYTTGSSALVLGAGHVYFKGMSTSSGTQQIRLVIYKDNGSGAPSTTPVAVTDPVTITQLTAVGWINLPSWTQFGGAPTLQPNTTYWMGVWWGSQTGTAQVNVALDNNASVDQYYNATLDYSSSANPNVAGNGGWTDATNTQQYSVYFDGSQPSNSGDIAGTISNTYDDAGRITQTIDANGAQENLSYDADGNLISREADTSTFSSGTHPTTTYSYDDANQLIAETDPAGKTYNFYYDSRGDFQATQYPNGTFNWQDTNALGELSDDYNRHGSISSQFNSNHQAISGASPSSDTSPLTDFTYTYNRDGERITQTSKIGAAANQTTSYSFDSIGRLQQVTPPSGNCSQYQYDAESNRTALLTAPASGGSCGSFSTASTYTYTAGADTPSDALTSQTGPTRSFAYDGGGSVLGDGMMTARGTDVLRYDGYGTLQSLTTGGHSVCYTYAPDGSLKTRIYDSTGSSSCTTATSTTNYLLGDLYETNATGNTTTSYDDGPTGDLASFSGSPVTATPTYLYYDGHGSQVATADTTGTIASTQSYDPWGAPQASIASNSTIHAFVGRFGKQYDTTSGLVLMGARPYDPVLGRFLSVDPIPGGSLNNYDYCNQDPVNCYDVNGLCGFLCTVTTVGQGYVGYAVGAVFAGGCALTGVGATVAAGCFAAGDVLGGTAWAIIQSQKKNQSLAQTASNVAQAIIGPLLPDPLDTNASESSDDSSPSAPDVSPQQEAEIVAGDASVVAAQVRITIQVRITMIELQANVRYRGSRPG